MSAKITVYWGERPSEESENHFLAQVKADLLHAGVDAVIFANFFTKSDSRQIDFVITTKHSTCLVELKNYGGILLGGTNGPWRSQDSEGTISTIERVNPYSQALSGKFAFSNDMTDYRSYLSSSVN